MAITKKLVINSRLDKRVKYVLNENKTTSLVNSIDYAVNKEKTKDEQTIYETALNCNLKTAFEDMINTKKGFNNNDKRLGYHIIQSFKPGETTPEIAHKIGCEFAQKSFGDRYEVVIATHLDKAHLHNHIIVNSVSFVDGKKYRDSKRDLFDGIRGRSDEICKKYGLSVITPEKNNKSLTYIEWLARKNERVSWQTIIRADIDDCVKQSFSYGNFLVLMEHKGYEIKQGKHVAFRPYGKERFARGYKLGDGYSEQNIRNRIAGKDLTSELPEVKTYTAQKQNNLFPKGKIIGIKALYVHYLYLLGLLKNNKLPDRAAFVLKEDLVKFETMTKTFAFLTNRNLETVEQVENYKSKCFDTIELLSANQIRNKAKAKKNDKIYTALVNLKTLERPYRLYMEGYRAMEPEYKGYLKARDTLKKAGYKTATQIAELEKEKSEITEVISRTGSDIRHFRYEIRMCNNALVENQHIEKKLNELKPQDKIRRREIEYEPSER